MSCNDSLQVMSPQDSTFSPRFPQGSGDRLAVALYEPEIPLNVGSVARTCACTGVPLHLVGTLGFRLDNRLARRAGLDYWELAHVHVHQTWEDFREQTGGRRKWFFSTSGGVSFWEASFQINDVLVFGSERTGLPDDLLGGHRSEVLAIPMMPERRSLNLSNAVAVALYEALRQLGSSGS